MVEGGRKEEDKQAFDSLVTEAAEEREEEECEVEGGGGAPGRGSETVAAAAPSAAAARALGVRGAVMLGQGKGVVKARWAGAGGGKVGGKGGKGGGKAQGPDASWVRGG